MTREIGRLTFDSLWKGFVDCIADNNALDSTGAIFAARNAEGIVESRELVWGDSFATVWGQRELRCPSESCSGTLRVFRHPRKLNRAAGPLHFLSVKCQTCDKTSGRIDRPLWVHPVKHHSLRLFWASTDEDLSAYMRANWSGLDRRQSGCNSSGSGSTDLMFAKGVSSCI